MSDDTDDWLDGRSNLMQMPLGRITELLLEGCEDLNSGRRLWWRIDWWHKAMPDLTVDQILRLIVIVHGRDKLIESDRAKGMDGDGYN